MTSKVANSSSYAIFSFVLDPARDTAMPIGVALWSPGRRFVKIRLLSETEKLTGFNVEEYYPFVRMVRSKVEHWMETGELPFAEVPVSPFEDAWWQHVRKLLIHRVRLSEPRPIDCRSPEDELEPLYETVVAPHRSRKEQRTRINGEITRCLGTLAPRFQVRPSLPGFRDRNVRVLRAYKGQHGWVVIEAVNLATNNADEESDATVGKLLRLREGGRGLERCAIMVGYLAPPEGLNGTGVLLDWIRERTNAKTFDLAKERAEFFATADRLVAQTDGQEVIP
jgi:hypothetical protein